VRRVNNRELHVAPQPRKRTVQRRRAAGHGAVGEPRAVVGRANLAIAETSGRPGGKTSGSRRVGHGQHARHTFGCDGQPHHRRMHVDPVADDFNGEFRTMQRHAGKARPAMMHRLHGVEEMRDLTRALGHGVKRHGLVRRGVAERHANAALYQPLDKGKAALNLRSQCDGGDLSREGLDDLAQVVCCEITFWADAPAGVAAWHGRPRADARGWLCPAERRADEVALEMRPQDSRTALHGRLPGRTHLFEHAPQITGSARDGGWAERRDAVTSPASSVSTPFTP
jgi:hypothetical protein